MPTNPGPEWDYVTVAEPEEDTDKPKNECKLCHHKFFGGATRIRLHFLRVHGCGVKGCDAPPEKLGPVAEVMQRVEDESKKKKQQAGQKRALDKATSSTAIAAAAASKKQRTLEECQRGATKAECDEAVARFLYGDGHPLSTTESPYFRDMLAKVRSIWHCKPASTSTTLQAPGNTYSPLSCSCAGCSIWPGLQAT